MRDRGVRWQAGRDHRSESLIEQDVNGALAAFFERKSPRKTANSSTSPFAGRLVVHASVVGVLVLDPPSRCTPFTPASLSTLAAYSVPMKSSSRFVARLLLDVIIVSARSPIFAVRPMER